MQILGMPLRAPTGKDAVSALPSAVVLAAVLEAVGALFTVVPSASSFMSSLLAMWCLNLMVVMGLDAMKHGMKAIVVQLVVLLLLVFPVAHPLGRGIAHGLGFA